MHGPILRLNLKTALLCYCMALYLSGTTLPILSLLKDFLSEIHHWLVNILKRKRIPHIKNRPCSKVVDWPRILNCEHKYLEHQGNMINHSSRELMLSNYDLEVLDFPGSSVVTLSFALWDTLGSKWQGCLTECSQLSFAEFFFKNHFLWLIAVEWYDPLKTDGENTEKLPHSQDYKSQALGVLCKHLPSSRVRC